jgi:hypothetical protein
MSRRTALAVGVLVAVQALLAWGVFVAAPHPGGDNAGYVALGHALVSGEGYTELWDPAAPPHTKYPPVFPLLLAVAMALGIEGWVGLKAVPLLATLAVAPAVLLWARTRVPETVAFGVAVVTALSPSLLYHSHWVLSDVPFVALTVWALWALSGVAGQAPEGEEHRRASGLRWLAAALLVVLAAFTRSAGLPLAGAAVVALALERRWRGAGGLAAVVGVPFLGWWLRGRSAVVAEGRYTREFFLLDPYQPDLGTASAGDFVARVVENLVGYLTRFLPDALVGGRGGAATLVVLVVVLLALIGWGRSLKDGRPGVAALFLPLYAGVILLWPPVWSGDRFALPLVPVLLVFAAEEAWRLARGWSGGARNAALVTLGLALALPAMADWTEARQEASRCRSVARAAGPWACGGPGLSDFAAAARWAGARLPAGSPVLTRKPRIWYLDSGLPTRTYPFSDAPGALLRAAEASGARHVVLDYVGGQGTRFVGGALASDPGRFCELAAVGGAGGVPPTRILEILPPGGDSGSRISAEGIRLAACPGAGEGSALPPARWSIPLLDGSLREDP